VIINYVALFFGQGPPADTEVIDLASVMDVLRDLQLEAPAVIRADLIVGLPRDDVFGLVGQQQLAHR